MSAAFDDRRATCASAGGAPRPDVRAIDAAGNVDPSPATRAWTVDVTAPDTTITSGPADLVAAWPASFSFTSSESGATFQCQFNGGAWSACATPKAYASLSEGAHSFAVRAIDAAGNVDPTPATRPWTIDLTAPDTTIASGPSGEVEASSALAAVEALVFARERRQAPWLRGRRGDRWRSDRCNSSCWAWGAST